VAADGHDFVRGAAEASEARQRRLAQGNIIAAPRFYPSSKACSQFGCVKDELPLDERTFHCEHCGFETDRDVNAALNLLHCGMNLLRLDAFRPDAKRTQEPRKTIGSPIAAVSTA
jgi:transposase